jgi:hypothetical protein
MKINLSALAQRKPELTLSVLTDYLKRTGWSAVKEVDKHWRILQQPAPCEHPVDCQTIWLPDTPEAPTPPGVGLAQWDYVFWQAIDTLAIYENKPIDDVLVPYRVLQILGSRHLAAVDRQPGAFTTFFPYRDVLNLVLDMALPPEPVAIRDILAHEAFQHWELLQPETAAEWSLSWEAHIEVEYRGYAAWIEKVR